MNRSILLVLICLVSILDYRAAKAETYFVDSDEGSDYSNGISTEFAWKTISKVNNFQFESGDYILFKRGGSWEETLIVSSSGTQNKPIVFSAYGEGPKPRIKCSNRYGQWVLKAKHEGLYLWQGHIDGIRNCWGALLNGGRIPKYWEYEVADSVFSAPIRIADMKEGVFYSPYNRDIFFLKTPSQVPPVSTEVGVREYGILVNSKNWINIEDLEVFGPGGNPRKGGSKYSYQLLIDNSHNIIIKNCDFRQHHRNGVMVTNGSSNISLQKIISKGHGNTGVYFWAAGVKNQITGSTVSECGTIISDKGDLGGIGIWKTTGLKISFTKIEGNGHPDMGIVDAAVSFVQSPFGIVENNVIKNAGGTALQFAANSDYGTAAYNIFDGWGSYPVKNTSVAVRIGGGKSDTTAKGCKIFNNLFINGKCRNREQAVVRTEKMRNEGLQIINNIFFNQDCPDIIAKSRDNFQDWKISYNFFCYKSKKVFLTENHDFSRVPSEIGNANIYSSDSPGIDLNKLQLLPSSACINAGKDLGLLIDFNRTPIKEGTPDIGPFEHLEQVEQVIIHE